jgi:hypothetical protein
MDIELHQFLHFMSAGEWIGLALMLFGSLALWLAEFIFLVRLFRRAIGSAFRRAVTRNPEPGTRNPTVSHRWLMIHVLCAIYLACFLYARFVEPNKLTEQRVVLESDKIPAGVTLRLAHITDLHAQKARREQLERAADAVAALKPDLVLLTGDYLCDYEAATLETLLAFTMRLPETPTFAVPGNYGGFYPADALLDQLGVEELHTEWRDIVIKGVPIELLGLSPTREPIAVPPQRHPASFGIVLEHFPALLPAAADSGWDLYLAGHTHGGQVRLPFYGALVTLDLRGKEFEWGAYRLGRTVGVVSAGLGMECRGWPQVRFLVPPEIVLIEIRGTRR